MSLVIISFAERVSSLVCVCSAFHVVNTRIIQRARCAAGAWLRDGIREANVQRGLFVCQPRWDLLPLSLCTSNQPFPHSLSGCASAQKRGGGGVSWVPFAIYLCAEGASYSIYCVSVSVGGWVYVLHTERRAYVYIYRYILPLSQTSLVRMYRHRYITCVRRGISGQHIAALAPHYYIYDILV